MLDTCPWWVAGFTIIRFRMPHYLCGINYEHLLLDTMCMVLILSILYQVTHV